jgi:predicted metal-dependent phosphotriesterase family hydrolase
VPLLREAGLAEEQIQTIRVENPRRVLSGDR